MGRNLNPKCKQCRRMGEKLFLKGDRCNTASCAIVKRNYPPGFHGPKGKKRQSDYGLQLAEKQKAKKVYNVLEKQLRLTFEEAKKQKGNTSEGIFKILETRLDNVVYRLGFASSRSKSRQLVGHGHISVNGKKVDIPSYKIKVGDVIKVKNAAKSKVFNGLIEKLEKYNAPSWLYLDAKDLSGKILHLPEMKEISNNINAQMIVEYYSR